MVFKDASLRTKEVQRTQQLPHSVPRYVSLSLHISLSPFSESIFYQESRTINDLEQRLIDAREKMIRVQYVLPDQWKIRCEYDPFELTRNVHDHFKTWLSSLVHDDDDFEYELIPKGKASTLVAQHFKDEQTFFDLQAGNNRLRYVVRFTKDCNSIINALEKTLLN